MDRRTTVMSSGDRLRVCAGSSRRSRWLVLPALAVLLPAVLGCSDGDSPTSPEGAAEFLVRVCRGSEHAPGGETFRVQIDDPAIVAQAQALIGLPASDPRRRILAGAVAPGNGGVNAPWSWHLVPSSIRFEEGTIELCDGCPRDIQQDVAAWIASVGTYCPWSTEVAARTR